MLDQDILVYAYETWRQIFTFWIYNGHVFHFILYLIHFRKYN